MSFKLERKIYSEEIDSFCYIYSHPVGAKLMFVKNSDKNKVFSATFKTLAEDNMGIPHILEHCVLCGSKKYPLKDPFNELCKGSLYTYLNAMTFKDKTMYPIASCNDKDFFNLTNVYLDAVFAPLIKERPEIFMQEGVNTNINKDGFKEYGGIVLNEMQGVYSDPSEYLDFLSYKALFKGTAYEYESGGKPEDIKELTYEKLISYYDRVYNASNVYFYFYGDLDIDFYLQHIHDNYLKNITLNKYEIPKFKLDNVKEKLYIKEEYSYDSDLGKDNKYFSIAYRLDENLGYKEILYIRILLIYLFAMEASPVKEKMLGEGFCGELNYYLDDSIHIPVFSLTAKNSSKDIALFVTEVDKSLKDIFKTGFDKNLMTSCINKYEFSAREENFGYRPKGLVYNIRTITDFINDKNPIEKFSILENLEEIRKDLENNNCKNFLRILLEYFINNKNKVFVELTLKNNNIEQVKELVTDRDLLKIKENIKLLENFRLKKDTKEDLEKIPLLSLKDLDKTPEKIPLNKTVVNEIEVLHVPLNTNSIIYFDLFVNTKVVSKDKLGYIGLLNYLLGKTDTKNYDKNTLNTEINTYLGGFNLGLKVFVPKNMDYNTYIILESKFLSRNLNKSLELISEVLINTTFKDEKAIFKSLKELLLRYQSSIVNNGNSFASSRVYSNLFEWGAYTEFAEGMEFYKFLKNIVDNFDKKEVLFELNNILKELINKNNIKISITCSDDIFNTIEQQLLEFLKDIPEFPVDIANCDFDKFSPKEAFTIPTKVQYVASAFNFKKLGLEFNGTFPVLENILDTAYLMQEVRIKGGAYGCYSSISRNGFFSFSSFRDPNIRETLEVYGGFLEFLKKFNADEREMRKFVIGALNKFIRPKHVSQKGDYIVTSYFNGIDYEDVLREREELISTTLKDIHKLVAALENGLKNAVICTLTSEEVYKKNEHFFEFKENLF